MVPGDRNNISISLSLSCQIANDLSANKTNILYKKAKFVVIVSFPPPCPADLVNPCGAGHPWPMGPSLSNSIFLIWTSSVEIFLVATGGKCLSLLHWRWISKHFKFNTILVIVPLFLLFLLWIQRVAIIADDPTSWLLHENWSSRINLPFLTNTKLFSDHSQLSQ